MKRDSSNKNNNNNNNVKQKTSGQSQFPEEIDYDRWRAKVLQENGQPSKTDVIPVSSLATLQTAYWTRW